MLSLSCLSGRIYKHPVADIKDLREKENSCLFLGLFFPFLSMSAQAAGQHVSSSKCRQNISIGPWWWTAVIMRNLRGKKKFILCSSYSFSAKCYIFFPRSVCCELLIWCYKQVKGDNWLLRSALIRLNGHNIIIISQLRQTLISNFRWHPFFNVAALVSRGFWLDSYTA